MRTRFIGTLAVPAAGALLLSAAAVFAQTPCPAGADGGWHKGKGCGKQLEQLNLTPEQKQKLDAQRKEKKSAMKGLEESLKAKRGELREEMDKEKTDKAKIESIGADLKRIEAQRIDQEISGILQMKEILTPEQFKKMSAMREEHKGGKHGKKWKGHTHGDDEGDTAAPVATPQSTTIAPPTGTVSK
ncbi:MAG: Spy/CpxP family protein refolding chaperone [Candidatus Aureabacteria bacterium]|nr:Spy/CpxP family protein refolding chaperone [Candidatus Auribacterota bacterium]